VREADAARGQSDMRLTRLAAESLYRAMAYKDEYEVARLYADPAYWEKLKATFEDPKAIRVMLAPPLLSRTDPATGRPKKKAFGPWIFPVFRLLARMKVLRETWADPFARTAERRAERDLRELTFADCALIAREVGTAPYGLLCEIARIPATVRGYGPVKEANREAAMKKRAVLMKQLEERAPELPMAAE
jgi:indolepyruvate ferredoxin oxidoreductase